MLPLVAWVPLQPADATQAVALVVLQVKVETPPVATIAGIACSVTVGASFVGGGVPVAVTGASADEQAASARLASNSAPHTESRPRTATHLSIFILSLIT
jgi:hypothetical protein